MAGHNFAIASACSEFSAALSAGQMFARKSRTDLRSRLRSASDTPSMFWGVEPFMGAREQRVEAYSQIQTPARWLSADDEVPETTAARRHSRVLTLVRWI